MKLSNNLTIEQRMNTEWGYQFDPMQCAEILDGARQGVNVELYANPNFEYEQMSYIRQGLENNVDISKYASTNYSHFLMEIIYHLLKDGAQFDDYILEGCLEVDKLIAAYDALCRRSGLMRLDEWAKYVIYEEAPYYVTHKGEPIDETSKQFDN